MMQTELEDSFTNLEKSLARLQDVVLFEGPNTDIVDDSLNMRFIFGYETFWKALKRLLEAYGLQVKNPRSAFQEAFQQDWIEEREVWIAMQNDRNFLDDEYSQDKATEVAQRVRGQYAPLLLQAYAVLQEKYKAL